MNGPFHGRQDREERRSGSFIRLFGQMVMLPFTVFIQGMEMFIRTMQGMQRATDEGMDVIAGEMTPVSGTASDGQSDLPEISSETSGVTNDDGAANPKEKTNMDDRDLSDDKKLKLVRYKIVFIKRDCEVAFPEVEELVSDSMDDTAYTAWKVAEFIQRLGDGNTQVPAKWGENYPENRPAPARPYRNGNILLGLPEEDKKYLRVYFQVLDRYDREEAKYEQQQIDVLKQIRDRIA